MQQGTKNVIKEYQAKIADLNKQMSERGLQLFQEKFLNAHFRGKPSNNWLYASQHAVLNLSPKALQVSKEVYFDIINLSMSSNNLDLRNEDLAVLSNAGENAGPQVLRLSFDEFSDYLTESEELIRIYNEDLQKARQAIDAQIKEEFQEAHDAIEAQFKPKTSGNPLNKA